MVILGKVGLGKVGWGSFNLGTFKGGRLGFLINFLMRLRAGLKNCFKENFSGWGKIASLLFAKISLLRKTSRQIPEIFNNSVRLLSKISFNPAPKFWCGGIILAISSKRFWPWKKSKTSLVKTKSISFSANFPEIMFPNIFIE